MYCTVQFFFLQTRDRESNTIRAYRLLYLSVSGPSFLPYIISFIFPLLHFFLLHSFSSFVSSLSLANISPSFIFFTYSILCPFFVDFIFPPPCIFSFPFFLHSYNLLLFSFLFSSILHFLAPFIFISLLFLPFPSHFLLRMTA